MRSAAALTWQAVHAERRRLIDDLAALPVEQWGTASLCPGWDVHDVVAHLVDTAKTTRRSFLRDMIAARGNFDRANARGIEREKRPDPADTLASLRAVTGFTRTPPAHHATRLVEAIVHGEDIRRPLGVAGAYPDSSVVAALEHQMRTPVAFGGGRERIAGLRLLDTATGASWGEGSAVEGSALDLLLAVSGRPIAAAQLTGPGAERLLDASTAPPD